MSQSIVSGPDDPAMIHDADLPPKVLLQARKNVSTGGLRHTLAAPLEGYPVGCFDPGG